MITPMSNVFSGNEGVYYDPTRDEILVLCRKEPRLYKAETGEHLESAFVYDVEYYNILKQEVLITGFGDLQ
jgi:hypothetical protein